jgi:hypothetical protein
MVGLSRAVTARRSLPLLAAALVAVAGCGGNGQDADEPSASYRLDVVNASFPAEQHIADSSTMRIRVRNAGNRTVPVVAVTVETRGGRRRGGLTSFGQSSGDADQADPNRPVWVLDRGPHGGTSAYSNTWTLGRLPPGRTKTFEWKLTPVEPGDYAVRYRLAAGLDGNARLAQGSRAGGSFKVTISDKPVPARVDDDGNVVRGEEAGAGN